jgi:hypothetical protein
MSVTWEQTYSIEKSVAADESPGTCAVEAISLKVLENERNPGLLGASTAASPLQSRAGTDS